ncbi:acyl-CoA dehydrogenase family protein [[Mycobacterium] vasticus]|uniref:Acyl-CoA dehydrogenase family protein n=1 Tax=[Mycobacterium] vasticus TaxID=2875777 RepID=A0ABU5Z240_9MYCO|nr:acyl-CoA dehydrogenase family protein [Mycolicibacter sp. MYC017]MEB3071470.1 acyl-CoA dehydrogenase family protein [Mycolicibacter sp. MYC017]
MKFDFTEEHEALRALIAEVCERESDPRGCYDGQSVIDTQLWAALREAGVLGVGVSEDCEGSGGGPVEQVMIAEGLGAAVGAIPFSEHVAAAEAISLFASDDQRKRLLVPLIHGESVAGIALPTAANLAAVQATPDSARWRLTGHLPLIPNAAAATTLVIPAQIGDEVRWFVTDAAHRTSLPTVDRTRAAARVDLEGTDAELLSGAPPNERPAELLLTLAAAEAVGCAATALNTTARYTTERHQFGLPIGTFQAVKHRLADMLVAVENARSAVYGAAWALAETSSAARSVSVAQAVATGNAVEVAGGAVQLHGGIGVTWECDLHLYLRRAKALEATYGSPAMHRRRIAESLLDG